MRKLVLIAVMAMALAACDDKDQDGTGKGHVVKAPEIDPGAATTGLMVLGLGCMILAARAPRK
jgi:hypothetical protein